jgi:hypothetical protein
VGSRVTIEAGGRRQTGWALTDSGYAAAKSPIGHFGLANAEQVDRIELTLPSGQLLCTDDPVSPRQRLQVREGR